MKCVRIFIKAFEVILGFKNQPFYRFCTGTILYILQRNLLCYAGHQEGKLQDGFRLYAKINLHENRGYHSWSRLIVVSLGFFTIYVHIQSKNRTLHLLYIIVTVTVIFRQIHIQMFLGQFTVYQCGVMKVYFANLQKRKFKIFRMAPQHISHRNKIFCVFLHFFARGVILRKRYIQAASVARYREHCTPRVQDLSLSGRLHVRTSEHIFQPTKLYTIMQRTEENKLAISQDGLGGTSIAELFKTKQ